MKNENVNELTEEELEKVSGGRLKYQAGDDIFQALGLDYLVKVTYISEFSNEKFYGVTWYGREDGKEVRGEEMLKYVSNAIGTNDDRYKALYNYCNNGSCTYNGRTYTA